MTIIISLMLTTSIFTTNINDTSYKIKDSCKIEFINKLFNAYSSKNGYWCVTSIVDCYHKKEQVKKLVSLKDIFNSISYFLDKGIMDSSSFKSYLASMIIDNGGIGLCHLCDNGKLEQRMPIKSVDTIFLNKISNTQLQNVLHNYFDRNKHLKKKYIKYQYELVWYCYEKNVIVFADESGKCFYIEPNICK